MRTITTEQHIYTWPELNEKAKERAAQYINSEHFWADESIASLDAFAAQFGVKVISWSYSPWGNADIETNATPAHFRGVTLAQAHNLPESFTGYCMDYTLREVFIKAFERTGDAHAAFVEAMDAGIKEARADWEAQYEESAIADHCEANGYEFTEEGKMI